MWSRYRSRALRPAGMSLYSVRGRPRARAHRPLPSMMIPACRVLLETKYKDIKKETSPVAHGLNQGFHVVQVPFQSVAACRHELVLGARQAAREGPSAVTVHDDSGVQSTFRNKV